MGRRPQPLHGWQKVFWFLNSMTLFYDFSNSNQTTDQPQCVCQPCEIGQLGWSRVGRGHNIQRPCNIHPNLFLKRSNDWRRIMWYKLTPKAPTSVFLILPSEVKLWHRWAVSRNLVTSSLVRVPDSLHKRGLTTSSQAPFQYRCFRTKILR